MPIFLIPTHEFTFPHPLHADPSGILGIGGDLSSKRLLLAYRFGIFPWYNVDEPIIWWFPDPRCVLFPTQVKISKSMRSVLNTGKYRITYDRNFSDVIKKCQIVKRKGQSGTWIHKEMIDAYAKLHQKGYAHSVEIWEDDDLVGGLYGISIGKIFFGESMFAEKPNTSKLALIKLAQKLESKGYTVIDCQQDTPHIRSMGAELISAHSFYNFLRENLANKDDEGDWREWGEDEE